MLNGSKHVPLLEVETPKQMYRFLMQKIEDAIQKVMIDRSQGRHVSAKCFVSKQLTESVGFEQYKMFYWKTERFKLTICLIKS